jgi:hypothetical protein
VTKRQKLIDLALGMYRNAWATDHYNTAGEDFIGIRYFHSKGEWWFKSTVELRAFAHKLVMGYRSYYE